MLDHPKRLGRYLLLDRIATGGTAEIYRGLHEDADLQRLVAVKCVHSDHANNEAFLKFFRAEIRVSLGLTHPSIVRTLDYGDDDGRPFIVFEYVHGRSVRQVAERIARLGKAFPISLAAYVGERAAAALQYAHTFREPISDRLLNIVHRDISPQNIMVSYDGAPKLIDFGIAKVLQDGDNTIAGYVKGKPAYLSPEQAAGTQLDPRTDLFSLGIVLWELLAGKRLFGGPKEDRASIMRAVLSPEVAIPPPSTHDRRVPPSLDAIVLRALERDRERRYQTALEIQNDLWKVLGTSSRDAYEKKASLLLNEIFAQEIEEEAAELRKLSQRAEELTRSSQHDASWLIPIHREVKEGTFTCSTALIRKKLGEKASGVRDFDFGEDLLERAELEPPRPSPQPEPVLGPAPAPSPAPVPKRPQSQIPLMPSIPALPHLASLKETLSAARARILARTTHREPDESGIPPGVRKTLLAGTMAAAFSVAFLVLTTPRSVELPPLSEPVAPRAQTQPALLPPIVAQPKPRAKTNSRAPAKKSHAPRKGKRRSSAR